MLILLVLLLELLALFIFSKHIGLQISRFLSNLTNHHKISGLMLALIFLPGTILHELSHYLMAVILRVRAVNFTLLPKIGQDNIVLGSVGIVHSDPLRRFLIGIAPIILGVAILFFSISYLINSSLSFASIYGLLIYYAIFTISNTMFSSKADLEGAGKLLFVVGLIILGIYLLGFKPQIDMFKDWLFLNQAQKILLIPIGLDFLALLILSLANYTFRRS
jgi:hypothetical protein